ncbi:MAG: hypothetical protein Fur0010_11190 [Bdellovibrio sp.]
MKKTLRWTQLEGMFFALMVASSESYALYYFTSNGMLDWQVAIASTLPLLFASTLQLFVPRFIKQKHLERGIVFFIGLQLLGLIGIYLSTKIHSPFIPLLISLILYWIGGQGVAPLWLDWSTKLSEQSQYGVFLSKRNTIITWMAMLCYIMISIPIKKGLISIPWLFLLGFFARFTSMLIQTYLHRRTKGVILEDDSSSQDFKIDFEIFKTMKRFFVWNALFRFAVNISSPFFLPFMVKVLKLSIEDFVLLNSVPFLGRALFLQNWSKASKGIRPFWGIQISCFFIAFLPWLWTISNDFVYLCLIQFMSGIFWGGMEMTNLLMIQNHSYGKARKWLGLNSAGMTFFSVLGATFAGYLSSRGFDYIDLFNLSTAIRLAVAMAFIANVTSLKPAHLDPKNARLYLFYVLSLRPSMANIGRILLPRKEVLSDDQKP